MFDVARFSDYIKSGYAWAFMRLRFVLVSFFTLFFSNLALADQYDATAQQAASYLELTQNLSDGSWGATDNLKPLYTSQVVQALYGYNRLKPQYYAGINWLENHRMLNVDYTARRMMALSPTKDDLSKDLAYLINAQNLPIPGNNGWGISSTYQGSPLDTALTLQALSAVVNNVNVSSAITYLQSTQLSGAESGWPLAQEGVSDPSTTAQAIIALAPRLGVSSPVITNAINTLKSKVNTGSSVSEQALAARAYLTVYANGTDAIPLLNNLKTIQNAGGMIGPDAYTTALALQAFATSAGKDLTALRDTVSVPDQNLRNAINQALGNNALDSLNKGDMANLITLDISGRNVKSLVGLEWATNLTYLNATNNLLASTAPISGLTNLTQVSLNGNPSNPAYIPPVKGADVPTLPEWGMIILGFIMLVQVIFLKRRTK